MRHRQLRWVCSMGNGVVGAVLGKKKYDVVVSTSQMCVLLLFNCSQQLTFDEIREKLNMSEQEAKRQLLTLSAGKFKVLKKEPKSNTLQPSDLFTVNDNFVSEKRRIKIPAISSKELVKIDKQSTIRSVTESRKHIIDATIVRIMKT